MLTDMSNRSIVSWRLACAFVAATALGAPVATSAQELPLVAAVPADALADAVGVNLHLNYCEASSNYCNGNYPHMKELLAGAGIRHYRDGAGVIRYWPHNENRFADLAASGLHEEAVVGDQETPEALRAFLRFSPAVDAIEGPNEPNMSHHVVNYPDDTIATVRALAPIAHEAGLPFVGPSIAWLNGGRDPYADLAPLGGLIDIGNVHDYPGGRNPGGRGYGPKWGDSAYGSINASLVVDKSMAGSAPVYATETGWGDGKGHTPRNIVARYEPRLFLEHYRRGVKRVYQYQFLDYGSDGFGDFGLVDRDMKPKPAYYALSNFVHTLADPGSAVTAKPLRLRISGTGESVHHLLMQKRDGSYWLALWIEKPAWDQDRQTPLGVEPVPAQLTVGSPASFRLVRTFNDDGNVGDRTASGSALNVVVTDHVSLIHIGAAS